MTQDPPLIVKMDISICWEAKEVPSLKELNKVIELMLKDAFKNSDFSITSLTGEFEAEL